MNKFIIAEVVFIVSSFAFPFLKSLKEALIGDKVIWKIGLASLASLREKVPPPKFAQTNKTHFHNWRHFK